MEGTAEPPVSTHTGEDKLPRRSARNRVPALSKAIANDGLAFRGATARVMSLQGHTARRERKVSVGSRVQWFRGFGGSEEVSTTKYRQRMRGIQWIAR